MIKKTCLVCGHTSLIIDNKKKNSASQNGFKDFIWMQNQTIKAVHFGQEQATLKLIEEREKELYKETEKSLKKMNHLITAIAFTVILGIVSGAPLLTCDKIKDVNQRKDNQDRYLVILKDPKSYQDAEYVIGLVDLYQWSLEMNAFNIHENLVRSQLELLDNVGLQGMLSKQALVLVSVIQCTIYTISLTDIYTYVGVHGQQSRVNHTRLSRTD